MMVMDVWVGKGGRVDNISRQVPVALAGGQRHPRNTSIRSPRTQTRPEYLFDGNGRESTRWAEFYNGRRQFLAQPWKGILFSAAKARDVLADTPQTPVLSTAQDPDTENACSLVMGATDEGPWICTADQVQCSTSVVGMRV